ncbi:MAG: alpha-hydroxy-acid oxidizing protein [Candidatus Heimdallarchaeota archaeon]|nr:alpha-hydroxy-acid oxidizing protein [Candidatus Heimdallarchaeota archaeon]
MNIANVFDFQKISKENISQMAYDYINGGSQDELTLNRNRNAFKKIKVKQFVLRDVDTIDTSHQVLGEKIPFPIMLAPISLHRLSHPEGELATARAAHKLDTIMILSSLSSTSLEDVAAAASGRKWFQLYWMSNKEVTKNIVDRAETNGYSAIVLTVDAPVLGKREKDVYNEFSLPEGIELMNYQGLDQAFLPDTGSTGGSGLAQYVMAQFNSALTWKDLDWLTSLTNLPILIKGVQTTQDAKLAVDYGMQGVIVSNHGGRQLDGSLSSIECLPRVTEAIKGEIEILLDSGVRRGSDVFKAIALGATSTVIGRPYIWGLGAAGEEGIQQVFEILRSEFEETMGLTGVSSVADITREYLEEKTIPDFS